jgi:hypothetical protein
VTEVQPRGVTQDRAIPNWCEQRRRETSEGEGALEREEATTAKKKTLECRLVGDLSGRFAG